MSVVVRFAPSPTGYLHIGGLRTALFNWLLALRHKGKFLLRIEDTDKARSTPEAIDAIIKGLDWVGINYQKPHLLQSTRAQRHQEVALELLALGKAYKCFCSQQEVEKTREEHQVFRSPWRDVPPEQHPNKEYSVRLKVPLDQEIVLKDMVGGDIVFLTDHIEDFVLLRSDGTPVFILAVATDDHDTGVTHILRGDDHVTNTPKQLLIYQSIGWNPPHIGHIPLIHGQDGAKLSKRHGATNVEQYISDGYLPEALCNYIMRLGWHYGDQEMISVESAAEIFEVKDLGKSPSRIDFDKMKHINSLYIKQTPATKILELISNKKDFTKYSLDYLCQAIDFVKNRVSLLTELYQELIVLLPDFMPQIQMEEISNAENLLIAYERLIHLDQTTKDKDLVQNYLKNPLINMKFGEFMKPIRYVVTGRKDGIGVFDIIQIMGLGHVMRRIKRAIDDFGITQ